jgi:hypothetical protein
MAVNLNQVAALALRSYTETVHKGWVTQAELQARRVTALRNFAAGDHPSALTPQMKEALRVRDGDLFQNFTDNYMDIVIQTAVDRCIVNSFDTPDEAGRKWVDDLLRDCRFDAMQTDIVESAMLDGDTYLLVYYDNAAGRALFSHEPAFDGESGMMVYYESAVAKFPSVAMKTWPVGADQRLTVYYPDRVERYIALAGQPFQPYVEPGQDAVSAWTTLTGGAIGLPVFHLVNRKRAGRTFGASDIEQVIPLQNALNRTLYSMVMSEELSAFMIRLAKGFEPPTSVQPGSWLKVGQALTEGGPIVPPSTPDEATALNAIAAESLDQAELAPFLDVARWLKTEISFVSRTPAPELMGGDSASGEALKQREIGLLGRVRRFQVRAGNVFEDAVRFAARLEDVFGTRAAPALDDLTCRWENAAVRNDTEVVTNATAVGDRVSKREFLRMIAPVYGWNEEKIEAILAEMDEDSAAAAQLARDTFQPPYGPVEPETPDDESDDELDAPDRPTAQPSTSEPETPEEAAA